jgi:hypothetical protein
MLGLAPFSGVPFSGYLIFSPTSTVSGLQANALLNSVTATPATDVSITGVSATASLNIGAGGVTFPVRWTTINTAQYPLE